MEETAKPQVVGQCANAVNTVQNASAAKKVLTLPKPEVQHLPNMKSKDASCTWEELAFEVVCGVCALGPLGCGDIVRGVRETVL